MLTSSVLDAGAPISRATASPEGQTDAFATHRVRSLTSCVPAHAVPFTILQAKGVVSMANTTTA